MSTLLNGSVSVLEYFWAHGTFITSMHVVEILEPIYIVKTVFS